MKQTPSQTVGPYFAYGLTSEQYLYDFGQWAHATMLDPLKHPELITIEGQVLDGEGKPIPDALVELWQNDTDYQLFGRCGTGTDSAHRFVFRTIKPRAVADSAPYITVMVFMRGQLIHSYTRLYFADEAQLNAQDPVLGAVPEARRHTLLAQPTPNGYRFDIRMQGDNETVFFEI